MAFLRWLGGIVVFFWILGYLLKFTGGAIHFLLVLAAVIFLLDWFTGKRRR